MQKKAMPGTGNALWKSLFIQ